MCNEIACIAQSNISNIIKGGVESFKNTINREGEFTGWDHNLDTRNRVGVIGTAIGIIALSFGDKDFVHMIDAADTLLKYRNPDYGWSTKSTDSQKEKKSLVWSTAYCIWALSRLNRPEDVKAIKKAVNWLRKGEINGGWGLEPNAEKQLVTSTTLVLMALVKSNKGHDLRENTIEWIKRAQNPDGGWGALPYETGTTFNSTTAHTGRAIYALKEAGVDSTHKSIKDGSKWLIDNQGVKGEWSSIYERRIFYNIPLVFTHAGHQWAILGLLSSDLGYINMPKFKDGIEILLKKRKDDSGAWSHEFISEHTPGWATLDSILALDLTLSKLPLLCGFKNDKVSGENLVIKSSTEYATLRAIKNRIEKIAKFLLCIIFLFILYIPIEYFTWEKMEPIFALLAIPIVFIANKLDAFGVLQKFLNKYFINYITIILCSLVGFSKPEYLKLDLEDHDL